MDKCIFCKIVKGEIPCHRVYEDNDYLAFLDIRPLNPGHTLVIPKKHYRWVFDLPDKELGVYFRVVKKIANALKRFLKADFVASAIIGMEVEHAHVWLVPRWFNDRHGDAIDFGKAEDIPKEEMEKIAEKARKALGLAD